MHALFELGTVVYARKSFSFQHLTPSSLLRLPPQEEPAAVTALQRELGQLTLSEGAGLGFGKVRACVHLYVRLS